MGTPKKSNDAEQGKHFIPIAPTFRNLSIQQRLKEMLTKAAVQLGNEKTITEDVNVSQSDDGTFIASPAKSKVNEGQKRRGNSHSDALDSLGKSRSALSTVKKGKFDLSDEAGSGSDDEVGKSVTQSGNRRNSVGSSSSDLSFSSKASNREKEEEMEEGGYILCLIALTSLLRGEISDSKATLFKAMQAELTLALKAYFPLPTTVRASTEVFIKMKRLVQALAPVLGVEVAESDCTKALQLLDAFDSDDCYDRKYLKTMREGGFMQYFCDIVTICKNFNSQ